jgi:osmoprotectant transport system permease protein
VSAPLAQTVVPNFGSGSSCVKNNGTFCWSWFSDHWSSTFFPALRQHIVLSLIALGVGFAISFGLALLAHQHRWAASPVTWVTGFLYTIPSLALFQILVPFTGFTTTTAEIGLVSYTLLILFRNTLTGLSAVPSEVREAARGMGLTSRQILWKVELPLAVPAMVAGIRIAAVTVVALATVAALVSNEGLGAPIFDGIQRSAFKTQIIGAGALAIGLALLADAVLVLLQRRVTPWARTQRA